MTILSIDTESNTWNKGNPFDRRFKTICYSTATQGASEAVKWDIQSTERLSCRIAEAKTIVGFNLKYDLHVLRTKGIQVGPGNQVWCCQLAEFIISNQTSRYPSLDDSLARYGLGQKVDVVKEEYWNKGIQTEDIPWEIFEEYARVDAEKTLELYFKQMEVMTPEQIRLCRLQCMDLLILQEMEWNGVIFNEELCNQRAEEIKNQISSISNELSSVYPNVRINFNSGDQLSAFLYGGTIVEDAKEHIGYFKTGIKAGQPKFKNIEIKHELPRLVAPLKGSELAKAGFYSTNADTLLKLKGGKNVKSILELVQKQTRLQTLLSKTYGGLVKIREEMNWEPGILHGQFNQVVAQTGRLSSSQPNVQNLDGEADNLFISRYHD